MALVALYGEGMALGIRGLDWAQGNLGVRLMGRGQLLEQTLKAMLQHLWGWLAEAGIAVAKCQVEITTALRC